MYREESLLANLFKNKGCGVSATKEQCGGRCGDADRGFWAEGEVWGSPAHCSPAAGRHPNASCIAWASLLAALQCQNYYNWNSKGTGWRSDFDHNCTANRCWSMNMSLLSAPDSAQTTDPACIVLWVVSPLLWLECCRCFWAAHKGKTDVPSVGPTAVLIHCGSSSCWDPVVRCCPVCVQVHGGCGWTQHRDYGQHQVLRQHHSIKQCALVRLCMVWGNLLLPPLLCTCAYSTPVCIPSPGISWYCAWDASP